MVIGSGAVLVYLGTSYLIEGARLSIEIWKTYPKLTALLSPFSSSISKLQPHEAENIVCSQSLKKRCVC